VRVSKIGAVVTLGRIALYVVGTLALAALYRLVKGAIQGTGFAFEAEFVVLMGLVGAGAAIVSEWRRKKSQAGDKPPSE
jgi:hypothetical protein